MINHRVIKLIKKQFRITCQRIIIKIKNRNGKLIERLGRKATGLRHIYARTAGLPKKLGAQSYFRAVFVFLGG
jgi:hypothetical protein